MGFSKCHGLRHAYVQRRYHELTRQFDSLGKGWVSPLAGGTPKKLLINAERVIDRKSR